MKEILCKAKQSIALKASNERVRIVPKAAGIVQSEAHRLTEGKAKHFRCQAERGLES